MCRKLDENLYRDALSLEYRFIIGISNWSFFIKNGLSLGAYIVETIVTLDCVACIMYVFITFSLSNFKHKQAKYKT